MESIEDSFVANLNTDGFAIAKVFQRNRKAKILLLRFQVNQMKIKIIKFAF